MKFFTSKYIINVNDKEYIARIEKFNQRVQITKINGTAVTKPTECRNLSEVIKNNKNDSNTITIECSSTHAQALYGIFPKVESSTLAAAVNKLGRYDKSDAERIAQNVAFYVLSSIRVYSKPHYEPSSADDVPLTINDFSQNKAFFVLNELSKSDRFDISGSLHLPSLNIIIFQTSIEAGNRLHNLNFILDYSSNHSRLSMEDISFDIDDGFVGLDKETKLYKALQKFFDTWKANNYRGALIPVETSVSSTIGSNNTQIGVEKANSKEEKQLIDPQLFIDTASWGDLDSIKKMIESGVNIETKNHKGRTALMSAAYKGHIEVVKFLLGKGADLEVKDNDGQTALDYAGIYYFTEIQDLLKNWPKDLKVKEQDNNNTWKIINLLQKGSPSEVEKKNDNLSATSVKQAADAVVSDLKNFNKLQARLKKINCENDIPEEFLCPISGEIMEEPITVSSGIAYDRKSLIEYFKTKGNPAELECPQTRHLIRIEELKFGTSRIIKSWIEKFIKEKEEGYAKQENKAADEVKQSENLQSICSSGIK